MTWLARLNKKIHAGLLNRWYQGHVLCYLLWPLSLVYAAIIKLRHVLYQRGIFKSTAVACPVIVVGNLTVGGTGKTPLVIALAQHLKNAGYRPGIVTRGYGSKTRSVNQVVTPESDPREVGDEPVLIAQATQCPVMKNRDRVQAAQALEHGCDVIISDDGLQHLALQRDIEVVLQPQQQWLKNKLLLPAGPWREPLSRLQSVDYMLSSEASTDPRQFQLKAHIQSIRPLQETADMASDLNHWQGQSVHAVCAIAMPWRFYALLRQLGMQVIEHTLPDHALLEPADLQFNDDKPIIITEKDAIKCQHIATANTWVAHVNIDTAPKFFEQLIAHLQQHKRVA